MKPILVASIVAMSCASAMADDPTAPGVDNEQLACLAQTIYHEARGEPIAGQYEVGWTVRNRLRRNWRGAETWCEVVTPDQFEGMLYANRPVQEPAAWSRAVEIAIDVMTWTGASPSSSDHFHVDDGRTRAWAESHLTTETVRIGDHVFYEHE